MKKLRFGTFLAPNILPVYQAVVDAVAIELGLATELVVESSYESCRDDVNDVCFVCSLPYVMFQREGVQPAIPVAAPVLRGRRYQNRPIYYSDVIVHVENEAQMFSDLRGQSWAYNEPLSHSGYGITRYHLVEIGETEGFFGKVLEAGFHETSIAMVRDRQVDAAAIDSQVLGVALRDDPDLSSSIRIIDSLGPSTIQPVAISKRIEPELRQKIVDTILRLHDTPDGRKALEAGLVHHFTPVSDETYDDIRRMVDVCESAGFMEIR